MHRFSASFAAVAVLVPALAMAAEPGPLASAAATWVAEGHVELRVSWEGGACEEPGEPTVEATDADPTTDAVQIPTVSTAEVCTMQIVQVEFSGLVPVEPLTETLAITVFDPEGRPKAAGSIGIAPASQAAADEGV